MNVSLEPRLIVETAERLQKRIGERFPGSGLLGVSASVSQIARDAEVKSADVARPHVPLRIASWTFGILLIGGLIAAFFKAKEATPAAGSITDLIQGADAAVNLVLLLGAGILSALKIEESIRRRKALRLVHALKSLAHVVDMHQLTKDPEAVFGEGPRTDSSPRRTMTPFELGRYLDYSSEMLSVIGKIAALYARHIQDPVVLEAIDGAEDLTTGLSRKIWQKIAILSDRPARKA